MKTKLTQTILLEYVTIFVLLIVSLSAANAENYAVLISAGLTEDDSTEFHSEYWYDLFLMYEVLYNNGFTYDNIYVLYGEGDDFESEVERYQVPGGWGNITDYSNTKSNMEDVFDDLSEEMTDDDFLFVWWLGHGNEDEEEGNCPNIYLEVENRGPLGPYNSSCDVRDNELAYWVNQISSANYKWRSFSFITCHSGGIIDDLESTKTVITTSTTCESGTQGFTGCDNLFHSELSYDLFSALNWKTPCYASVDADDNDNGLVSMHEGWIYIEESNRNNNPQHSDPGSIGDNMYIFCGGTLERNITFLNGDYTSLSNNVYVPSARTLAFAAGSSINLESHAITIGSSGTLMLYQNMEIPSGAIAFTNGSTLNMTSNYYLKATNGTLTRSGTVTVSPEDIQVKSGSTLKGQYSKIQDAIDNASSGEDVWVSTYAPPAGDINMKSGVDVRSGVAGRPVIDGDVYFDDADCVLEDFQVDGTIYFEGSSYADVYGINSLLDSGTALSVTDYSMVGAIDFRSVYTDDVGIYCYNAGVYVDGAEIESVDKAVHYPWYGAFELVDFDFCQNDLDIDKYYSAWIDIEDYNTFSGYLPYYCSGVREIEYPDHYDYCYAKAASPPDTRQAEALEIEPVSISKAGEETYDQGMSLLREITQKRIAAIREDVEWNAQDFASEYNEAISLLKQAISESLDTGRTWIAINKIASSYRRLGREEETYQYLTNLKQDSKHAALRPIVDNQLISYHLRQGDAETAVELAENLLASEINAEDRAALLYRLGNIYRSKLNNPSQAAIYYRQVITHFSEDPACELAQAKLERMGEAIPPIKKESEEMVTELSLSGYPNPFNPAATVSFSLPEGGDVSLIVYDMLGREVIRLAEGFRDAGRHELTWDGRDSEGLQVPTGIYITKLSTPLETKVIRMLMMK